MATSNRKLEVKAIVSVDGEPVDFIRLKIFQEMGNHHDFEVLLDYKTFDPQFFNTPEQKLQWVHSKVIIDLMHGDDEGNAYVFSGIVTNMRMIAEDGLHGGVLLTGKSTTIELERGKMMQTFSNTNLKLILEEITGGTLNLTKTLKPAWTSDIDFAIQYRESDWAFMQRLLNSFNERYYFSGTDLLVGPHPEWPVVPLKYDLELRSLELGSRLMPNQYENYYYKRENHATLKQDAPGSIDGATQWLQQVSSRNDRLTMSRKPNIPTTAAINDMAGLIEATKRQKVATGAEMLYVSGECKTCDVRIGRLIDISMPANMGGANVGTYRVYKVIHELDHIHKYKCAFEAVPADLEYLPTPEIPVPAVYPIEAEVFDNEDPLGLGRIKVKFPFDKRQCDTWIPTSSLDAGGNGQGLGPVNRGFIFIPEISDSVLINFLDGQQCSKPVAIGSMFHGNNADNQGGGKGNHIKSITDKSNGQIIMNTDEKSAWGITVRDRKGDLVHIDSKGENIVITANKNVTINAGETMTLNARNLNINVRENMSTHVGNNQQTNVVKNKELVVGETIDISAINKNEVIDKNKTTNVGKKTTYSSGDIRMFSTEKDIIVKSIGKAMVQGATDARISKG